MRFARIEKDGRVGLATLREEKLHAIFADEKSFPGSLEAIVASGAPKLAEADSTLAKGEALSVDAVKFLPPFTTGKILCVGLNYVDHSKESGYELPEYPTIFARFATSLVGHKQPIVRPSVSTMLDYEGEMVAIIGKGGRAISKDSALDHICGYSIFNDGSIRDYQRKTPQWTVGKNFDKTGGFGPYFVTADELPRGATGLKLTTRLNDQIVQEASTSDLVFDVASLVSLLSVAITLEPGDLLVTGTPSGVGAAREPQLWMKPGDVCTVAIEKIGVLENHVVDETSK
jgi:2-keto-4-pentenoate hydratase/2-oxohepta-3-ene-1,7-dioic acid hydratase in catechol pathway